MREPFSWPGFRRRVQQQADYMERVYQRVVEEGPLGGGRPAYLHPQARPRRRINARALK